MDSSPCRAEQTKGRRIRVWKRGVRRPTPSSERKTIMVSQSTVVGFGGMRVSGLRRKSVEAGA